MVASRGAPALGTQGGGWTTIARVMAGAGIRPQERHLVLLVAGVFAALEAGRSSHGPLDPDRPDGRH